MQKYKIVVAYEGTNYFGWQQQKNLPTVAGTLQKVFHSVFGKKIFLLGASRTDAGVHACGQIAQFSIDMFIEPNKMMQAWNNRLPAEIVITKLEPVDFNFNIHGRVIQKIYHYNFFLDRPLPTVQRFGWYFRYAVDLQKLNEILQVFVGTHDFRSFCTGYDREDTVRTINSAHVEYDSALGAHKIVITGPKFLRYMVRRIVGAALEVASRDYLTKDCLLKALEEKNPEQLLPNAPAKGLLLSVIEYKK
ncbi:tRNA pseudouridine(38-40) synthase TruA [bacterium]|nr:tRNA pseudouridine(38-40) synthase TruA [bacterium]